MSLDDQPLKLIDCKDYVTGFFWEDVGFVELDAGVHYLEFKNADGFNAINTFTVLDEGSLVSFKRDSIELASSTPNIYILEIENSFDVIETGLIKKSNIYSSGEAVYLNEHEELNGRLDLVISGMYDVALKASTSDSDEPIILNIGNQDLNLHSDISDNGTRWLSAGPVHLDEGVNQLKVTPMDDAVIDAFILYTHEFENSPDKIFQRTDEPAEILYEQIDPTRYRVRVQANRPFMLALAETYDPLWVASSSGEQINSIPLYGVINGFYIDQTGSFEVIIEYNAQQWARFGSIITVIVIIGIIPIYLYLRQRKPKTN